MKNKFENILAILIMLALITVSCIKQKELIALIHYYDKYNLHQTFRILPWGINKWEAKVLLEDETIVSSNKQVTVYDDTNSFNGPSKTTYSFNKNYKLFQESITYTSYASDRYRRSYSLKDDQVTIMMDEIYKGVGSDYQEVLRSFTWREGSEIKSEEGESVLETIGNDPWDKEYNDKAMINKDFEYKEVYLYKKMRIEITIKKEGVLISSTIETTNLKLEPKVTNWCIFSW